MIRHPRPKTRHRRAMAGRFAGLLIVAAAALAIAWPQPAASQDADLRSLADRINQLQRDLRTLERAFYRGDPPARPAGPAATEAPIASGQLAQAELRLSRLERQIRAATGGMEQLQHKIDVLTRRLDKLVTDVDFRLTEIERKLAATASVPAETAGPAAVTGAAAGQAAPDGQDRATPAPAAQQAAVAAPGSLPEGTAMEQYNFALSLLRKLRFDDAERAFKEFLDRNGADRLAGNAQYWLGETYYTRGELEQAARTFLEGIKRYPESTKAPDTMLKLAVTLRRMGQASEACATLSELQARFPNMTTQIRQKARQELSASSCG